MMKFLFFVFFLGLTVQVMHSQSTLPASQTCVGCRAPPNAAIMNVFNLQAQAFGPAISCGDKICNTARGETCATCPADCGTCVYASEIRGCVNKGHVHLTFDDGPTKFLPALLDALKSLNIKASFYLNGERVMETIESASVVGKTTGFSTSALSDAVKRAYNEGHVIGTHTYSHVGLVLGTTGSSEASALGYMSVDPIRLQMLLNDILIYDIIGKYPLAFRPPYLEVNTTVLNLIESMGYIPISIDVDSKDYASTASSAILTNVNTDVTINKNVNGLIALFHDGYQLTIDSLPTVVNQLKQQGFTFVDLPTCLNKPLTSFYRTSLFTKASTSSSTSSSSTSSSSSTTSVKTSTTSTAPAVSTATSTKPTSTPTVTSVQASAGSYLVAEWVHYLFEAIGVALATLGFI